MIRHLCRFEGVGGAKWSTNASACVIPTMRISMAALGKAVASAVSSGRHEITNSTPRTPSIGPDIEAWKGEYEAQITSTKNARWKAFLDTLIQDMGRARNMVRSSITEIFLMLICRNLLLKRVSRQKFIR